MAKSRESIIAELDARKIGYTDEMSYIEISELLKKAKDEETASEAVEAMEPLNTDMAGVKCGVSTIHDHEMRMRVAERALSKIEVAVRDLEKKFFSHIKEMTK